MSNKAEVKISIPDVMHAVIVPNYGDVNVLQYTSDFPTPKIDPNDPSSNDKVVVKMHYASVNPLDCKIRKGLYRLLYRIKTPFIPGCDGSGEVVQVGSNVKKFKVGDKVLGWNTRFGTYSEYVNFKESDLVLKPDSISFEEAAALPLVGLAAYQSLVETARLREGQTILIHGGSGGVGHVAVQLAKHLGATVIATCSKDNLNFVRSLGADKVIDYNERFEELTPDVDVVLDTVGGTRIMDKSWDLLREKRGKFITIVADDYFVGVKGMLNLIKMGTFLVWKKFLAYCFFQPSYHLVSSRMDADQLNELVKLVAERKIQPKIAQVYKLSDAKKPHEALENRKSGGKILLDILNSISPSYSMFSKQQ